MASRYQTGQPQLRLHDLSYQVHSSPRGGHRPALLKKGSSKKPRKTLLSHSCHRYQRLSCCRRSSNPSKSSQSKGHTRNTPQLLFVTAARRRRDTRGSSAAAGQQDKAHREREGGGDLPCAAGLKHQFGVAPPPAAPVAEGGSSSAPLPPLQPALPPAAGAGARPLSPAHTASVPRAGAGSRPAPLRSLPQPLPEERPYPPVLAACPRRAGRREPGGVTRAGSAAPRPVPLTRWRRPGRRAGT